MFGGNAVEHPRGVKGAGHVARPVFMPRNHPLQQDGKDLVRIHKAAVFRRCSDSVGIAIGNESRVAFLLDHDFAGAHVRLNGLRVDSRKERIDLTANLHMLDAGFEDIRQHVAP